jgi:transposase
VHRAERHEAHKLHERPYKAFYEKGQHVLAYHRQGDRWQEAAVEEDRGDGSYVLAWKDGTKTDRVQSSNNMRLSPFDQFLRIELGSIGLA